MQPQVMTKLSIPVCRFAAPPAVSWWSFLGDEYTTTMKRVSGSALLDIGLQVGEARNIIDRQLAV